MRKGQTLAEVARYTAAADQERLAESAARRLATKPVTTTRKPKKSA